MSPNRVCGLSAPRLRGLSRVTERDFIDPTDRQPASIRQLDAPGVNTRGSRTQHEAGQLRIAIVGHFRGRLLSQSPDEFRRDRGVPHGRAPV